MTESVYMIFFEILLLLLCFQLYDQDLAPLKKNFVRMKLNGQYILAEILYIVQTQDFILGTRFGHLCMYMFM